MSRLSPKLRIVLVAPRIAQNVGTIARTCQALGAELHLVGPLGFHLGQKQLQRASVGYWNELSPVTYRDSQDFWGRFSVSDGSELFFATKRGAASLWEQSFGSDVVLIFGNEEEGVAESFWENRGLDRIVACRIPTVKVRCLNLGISVAVFGFEVCRQWGKGVDLQIGDANQPEI
ncbi:MAG: tRNA (uridine(34)/cytosine(34)/5-carboxymethylaminomethyluridine(34)-2'-O)-methyltransferase TrmL [Deltaproteobacteria bacterium CG11_big_fil_rev_8_21_14_0_20_45_16]|nr:MAG: tRNA (uridine(34)/cytosine(34)/5-carboxymethylaminomethyluridine(34)-2'-O)-methyltransferase TrmL [Deltaproteobacteria bacterium CG11_big_fil_rev_8_21_14_0_20_45_16]